MRPSYYRLDEAHQVVPATRDEMYAMFEGDHEKIRRVGQTRVGDAEVSTVFLVIDHQYGDGPPVVFKTMIFGGEHDQSQWRYSTWDEAATGHERIVAALRAGAEVPR